MPASILQPPPSASSNPSNPVGIADIRYSSTTILNVVVAVAATRTGVVADRAGVAERAGRVWVGEAGNAVEEGVAERRTARVGEAVREGSGEGVPEGCRIPQARRKRIPADPQTAFAMAVVVR
jgi:hypothetical protein